jgi:hypothetical protein
MGISKFEFRPVESLQYRGRGGYGLESAEEAREGYSLLYRWSRTHVNLGAPFKLIDFRQYTVLYIQMNETLHVFTPSAVVTYINCRILHLIILLY